MLHLPEHTSPQLVHNFRKLYEGRLILEDRSAQSLSLYLQPVGNDHLG